MINIAIIGYGYWGKNLVRNFYAQRKGNVKLVVDFDENKLSGLRQLYPTINTSQAIEDVFSDPLIDAVVIATPVFNHFELAKKALQAGKHVLVEKPMTSTFAQAEELINMASRKNLILMVDHTFLYTSAVDKMKALVHDGSLGNLRYIDSTRINLGLFQHDVNVLWDLAPHDISICNYLIGDKPYSVHATGISHTNNGIENIAYLTINYNSNIIAHFNCSWTSPVKIRQMLLGGDKKMIVWNDLEANEKIKIYDSGYNMKTDEDRNKILVDYRVGDIFVPKLIQNEALYDMTFDFLQCIETGQTPRSNSEIGLTVVKILECADLSLRNQGKEVILNW